MTGSPSRSASSPTTGSSASRALSTRYDCTSAAPRAVDERAMPSRSPRPRRSSSARRAIASAWSWWAACEAAWLARSRRLASSAGSPVTVIPCRSKLTPWSKEPRASARSAAADSAILAWAATASPSGPSGAARWASR